MKSFENIWKEYKQYRYRQLEKSGMGDEIQFQYELEEMKEDFMDFYTFLKLREEV